MEHPVLCDEIGKIVLVVVAHPVAENGDPVAIGLPGFRRTAPIAQLPLGPCEKESALQPADITVIGEEAEIVALVAVAAQIGADTRMQPARCDHRNAVGASPDDAACPGRKDVAEPVVVQQRISVQPAGHAFDAPYAADAVSCSW